MKTIVKTLIVMAIAIFSISANAQNSYIEFAEKGIVSNEEVFKTFDAHQKEKLMIENNKIDREYRLKIEECRQKEEILEVWQSIFAIFAVFGSIIFIVFIIIQYHKTKNKKQQEIIENIINKEEFHYTQNDNKLLELLLQQDKTIKYSKFITDITILGIGLGLIFIPEKDEYEIETFGLILTFVGIGRIIVRSCILAFDTIKNKKEEKTHEEPTIENKLIENIEAVEISENNKENSIETVETELVNNENKENNCNEK